MTSVVEYQFLGTQIEDDFLPKSDCDFFEMEKCRGDKKIVAIF